MTSRPSQPHRAFRGKASGDDDDGRTHEEQGDAEVQDQVPGAELGGVRGVAAPTGDITVWFDAHAVDSWNAAPSGRPGGQKEYSDVAIETALTLRSLFHLGLRQTEGFVGSLVRSMGLELRVPDHTTLSRRGRTVPVRSLPRKGDGPLHLVIDSTGLKVVGGGQWNSDKHGDSKKRRQWRKLHLGIDLGGCIPAEC